MNNLDAKILEIRKELDKLQKNNNIKTFDYENATENVCRIQVHSRIFDWCQPPNKNKGTSGTGTGFVMKNLQSREKNEIYIVTAHHVVSNAIQIKVNFNKISSEDIPAQLVGCNPAMDVALLSIKSELKHTIQGFEMGNSDKIKRLKDVKAMGFALGKPHLQISAGVVSGRISDPSRLQIDVAVNPGNSGGPLLDENDNVIGIVTSGLSDAQGINYVAPIHESIIILERIIAKSCKAIPESLVAYGAYYDVIPSLNAKFSKANQVILDNIPNNKERNGIYCTPVHPKIEYPQTIPEAIDNLEASNDELCRRCKEQISNFILPHAMSRCKWKHILKNSFNNQEVAHLLNCIRNNCIKKGDIITHIKINDEKKYAIDNQMNCKYEFWADSIMFSSVLDRLQLRDVVEFDVYRKNATTQFLTIKSLLSETEDVYREMHSDTEIVPYLALAGIFTMPLLENHVPLFKRHNMRDLMNSPQASHESLLFITHILPESPFNDAETIGIGDIIIGINENSVNTLYQLQMRWDTLMSSQSSVTLHMRDGSISSATYNDIVNSEKIIREQYNNEFVKSEV
jgi:S1-C subfamily serine protease